MDITALLALVGAYLLGSIPFGLIIGKFAGTGDIRQVGSGNIGATNMMRAGGKKLGALTLLCDLLKGSVAIWLGIALAPEYVCVAALLAVVGHCYPVWLKFRGGKGVATMLGTLLVLTPMAGFGFISVWASVFAISRISALAALIAIGITPLFVYPLLGVEQTLIITVMAFIVIIRHKENIVRMLQRKELSFDESEDDK